MTEKRFTQKDEDDWEILDRNKHFAYAHSGYQAKKIIQELNELVETNRELYKDNKQLKHQLKKIQSKYDKSKTDEVRILVETENTVLLDKSEFEEYVRRHNELKRRNKRRKEKNRKYRNELKKRLREINGLKDFVQEDLSKDDKVLRGFIDEYL